MGYLGRILTDHAYTMHEAVSVLRTVIPDSASVDGRAFLVGRDL